MFDEFNKSGRENILCFDYSSIGKMFSEHDEEFFFVKDMKRFPENNGKKRLIENAKHSISLTQEHTIKENNILSFITGNTLSKKTGKKMLIKFEKIFWEDRKNEKIV